MLPIDLRSDTVTRPSVAMRQAMAGAEVGDDVFGEDPTVRLLEDEVATLLGKEAALFVPSGTMANQLALLVHCERGDEVICGEGSHCVLYESGAGAAWAGVQFAVVGVGGFFRAGDAARVLRPDHHWLPRSRLVWIENTHNRAGGRLFPQSDVIDAGELAYQNGLALHLDGARLWNAAAASGRSVRELALPADTVSVCFSKGLGAPVGSCLAGSRDHVRRARRFRKMLGGGMRQVGVLAAAARFALEHNRERLVEDHEHARALGAALDGAGGARVILPETNVVMIELEEPIAEDAADAARRLGVLVSTMDPHRLRAVFHMDVPATAGVRAAEVLRGVLTAARR